ncbi:hypothetical protein GCM10010424_51950 [Streptomyces lienomycini]
MRYACDGDSLLFPARRPVSPLGVGVVRPQAPYGRVVSFDHVSFDHVSFDHVWSGHTVTGTCGAATR